MDNAPTTHRTRVWFCVYSYPITPVVHYCPGLDCLLVLVPVKSVAKVLQFAITVGQEHAGSRHRPRSCLPFLLFSSLRSPFSSMYPNQNMLYMIWFTWRRLCACGTDNYGCSHCLCHGGYVHTTHFFTLLVPFGWLVPALVCVVWLRTGGHWHAHGNARCYVCYSTNI